MHQEGVNRVIFGYSPHDLDIGNGETSVTLEDMLVSGSRSLFLLAPPPSDSGLDVHEEDVKLVDFTMSNVSLDVL